MLCVCWGWRRLRRACCVSFGVATPKRSSNGTKRNRTTDSIPGSDETKRYRPECERMFGCYVCFWTVNVLPIGFYLSFLRFVKLPTWVEAHVVSYVLNFGLFLSIYIYYNLIDVVILQFHKMIMSKYRKISYVVILTFLINLRTFGRNCTVPKLSWKILWLNYCNCIGV